MHEKLIVNEGAGLMNSLLKNNKSEIEVEMNDGTIINGSDYNMSFAYENIFRFI